MTEEGEAQRSIGADAVETVFRDIGDLINRGGAEIGKFLRLQVPQTFSIGLRSGA